MKLTVVGCSGSFPGPDSAASSYLVESDGYRVVLDLGNGALGALQRYASLDAIDAVLISHLHVDHMIDLCSFYVARRYRPAGPLPRLRVLGPAGTHEHVAAASGSTVAALDEVFSFEVHAHVAEVGPFRVTSARVNHPVEAYGLRLAAAGRSLTYSGDTGPCQGLVDLARDCEVLLAEASFVDGEANPPDLHLTGSQAGEVARDAGVGQLLVTHVPPWHDREHAVSEAQGVFDGPVVAATPGLSVVV